MISLNKTHRDIALFLADKLELHGFPLSFYEMLIARIVNTGYVLTKKEEFALCLSVLKMKEAVLNYCNTKEVPKEVYQKFADMICGDFLYTKQQTGSLTLGDLDFSGAITSLAEGDVKVTFAENSSDSDKLSAWLQSMMSWKSGGLSCYRKLRW